MDIQEIVETYIRENGFDGLYIPGECGCAVDDLFPCGGDGNVLECEAGYRSEDESSEYDFVIGPKKVKEAPDG